MIENYIKWLEKKIEHNKRLMDDYDCDFNYFLKDDSDMMEGIADFLRGKEVAEEPKYYTLIKGHELLKGKGDWVVPTYWCLDTTNGNMFISDRITVRDKFLIEASKSEWNKLGINELNADFVKIEEME